MASTGKLNMSFARGWRFGRMTGRELTPREIQAGFPYLDSDAFAQGNVDGVLNDRTRMDTLPAVKVRPADGYEGVEFWARLGEEFGSLANRLRRKGESVVSAATWQDVQALPGFAGGPEDAPAALVLAEDDSDA